MHMTTGVTRGMTRRSVNISGIVQMTEGTMEGVTKIDAGSGWAITAPIPGRTTGMAAATSFLLVRGTVLAPATMSIAVPTGMAEAPTTSTAPTTTAGGATAQRDPPDPATAALTCVVAGTRAARQTVTVLVAAMLAVPVAAMRRVSRAAGKTHTPGFMRMAAEGTTITRGRRCRCEEAACCLTAEVGCVTEPRTSRSLTCPRRACPRDAAACCKLGSAGWP